MTSLSLQTRNVPEVGNNNRLMPSEDSHHSKEWPGKENSSIMSTGVGVSSCCLSGKVHDGKPVGHVETVGGLQTYVSAPKDGSKAKSVIFITDSKSTLSSHLLYRLSPTRCDNGCIHHAPFQSFTTLTRTSSSLILTHHPLSLRLGAPQCSPPRR